MLHIGAAAVWAAARFVVFTLLAAGRADHALFKIKLVIFDKSIFLHAAILSILPSCARLLGKSFYHLRKKNGAQALFRDLRTAGKSHFFHC